MDHITCYRPRKKGNEEMITEILVAILVGLCFDRAQMQISATNYGALFNGFGVIELTTKRNIKAPMAYRVLVPFLVTWVVQIFHIQEKYKVFVYQAIKAFFVIVAAWSVIYVFGYFAMFLTFSVLLMTIHYDYWDWPIELAAVVLAIGGHLYLALLLGTLFALSRETAVVTGIFYLAATWDWLGAILISIVVVLVLYFVRQYVGKRELYCKRVMWKYNIRLFKDFWKWKPFLYSPLFVSVFITIGTVLSILIRPVFWPVSILLVAGWVLAKADEPRIFSACIPFIAVLIGGAIT